MAGNINNYADGSKEDLRIVRDSVISQMIREYERNQYVTVREVVRDIWEDLDVALVGTDRRHQKLRVKVMGDILKGLGISSKTPYMIEQYFAQVYNNPLQEPAGRR